MPRPSPFVHRVPVRYLEVDQQGVVFNMWYLAYLDDAMTAYLLAGGLPYTGMLAAGFDVQLVHTELDWEASLGWGDVATVAVNLARLGSTSFTLAFALGAGGRPVARASTVYVVVRTDGSGKCPIPRLLLDALGDGSPPPSR
ncbi:MAG TPA: thioesterase family protein [Acidimicrobiales bacterium]|nr:thioesterase family protein [Acidimicrobiales bacterium]